MACIDLHLHDTSKTQRHPSAGILPSPRRSHAFCPQTFTTSLQRKHLTAQLVPPVLWPFASVIRFSTPARFWSGPPSRPSGIVAPLLVPLGPFPAPRDTTPRKPSWMSQMRCQASLHHPCQSIWERLIVHVVYVCVCLILPHVASTVSSCNCQLVAASPRASRKHPEPAIRGAVQVCAYNQQGPCGKLHESPKTDHRLNLTWSALRMLHSDGSSISLALSWASLAQRNSQLCQDET